MSSNTTAFSSELFWISLVFPQTEIGPNKLLDALPDPSLEMWEALKKNSLSYDESFTSLSRRHNVSALNAEAEDAMPLLWGNVFEDSILSFKEFKLGKNDLVLSKNVFNLGLKSSFLTPSKKNSYSKSVDSSNVIFVFVKDSFRVKLIDGLIGIWLSIFPQYFINAMFEGDVHEVDLRFKVF